MAIDKTLNICHLASGDLWAGAEVQMFTLVSILKKVPGINISAIVLNEGRLYSMLKDNGIVVDVIDEKKYGFYQIYRRLGAIARQRNLDILHSHRYKENILGGLMKKKSLVRRAVQTVHGGEEPFSGIRKLKSDLYIFLNIYFSRKFFDKIIGVSHDVSGRLQEVYGKDKVATVHNAINPESIRPTRDREQTRADLGIGSHDYVIGTAGRLVPIKGLDIFLEMASHMIKSSGKVKFLVVGDGPLRGDLEKKAVDLNIQNDVRFLGFRDDIVNIMNCLDIFVVSSINEGIPMAVLEVMGMGIPVVATRVGGLKEIIEHNKSGLFVEAGDYRGLADACLSVLEQPNLRASLGAGARERIAAEFYPHIQRESILKIYGEVLSGQ